MTEQKQSLELPDKKTLTSRATHGIRGKKRKEITRAVQKYYRAYNRNPGEFTAKPIKRTWFFLQFTGAKNVLDIPSKIKLQDYVELSEHDLINDPQYKNLRGEECSACGTHVRNYYLVHRIGDSAEVHQIGYDCMDRLRKHFSIGLGTIQFCQEKEKQKSKNRTKELELIVSEEFEQDNRTAWLSQAQETPDGRRDPTIGLKLLQHRGSYADWLFDEEPPEEIKQLLGEANNPHTKFPRHKQKQLWAYVAEHKLCPAANYRGIIDDLELFEDEGLIDLSKNKKFLNSLSRTKEDTKDEQKIHQVTNKRIAQILDDIAPFDFRAERKKRNETAIKKYDGFVLAQALDDILPVFEMDQGLWHNAFVNQQYLYEKALSTTDYQFIHKLTTRWLSGIPRALEGYDRTRLYHLATSIEPVKRFEGIVERLAVIQRKLSYAKKTLTDKEYEELRKIQDKLSRAAPTKKLESLKKELAGIAEIIADPHKVLKSEGAITAEDFPASAKLEIPLKTLLDRLQKSYAEGENTWRVYRPKITLVQEHANAGFATRKDTAIIKKLYKRVQNYASIEALPKKQYIRAVQNTAKNPLVTGIYFQNKPLLLDLETFANADFLDETALKKLFRSVKRVPRTQELAVHIGEDYARLRSELYRAGITEQDAIARKEALEKKLGRNCIIYEPSQRNDIDLKLFLIDTKPTALSFAEAITNRRKPWQYVAYISPAVIKDLDENLVRLKEIASDAEFRKSIDAVLARQNPPYEEIDKTALKTLFSVQTIKKDTEMQPIYVHKELKNRITESLIGS